MFDDLAVDVNYNSLSQNRQEGQTLLIKSLPKPLILIRNFPVFDEGIFALLNAVADLGYLIDILNISCCCGKREHCEETEEKARRKEHCQPFNQGNFYDCLRLSIRLV
jgi:hypothetical protein